MEAQDFESGGKQDSVTISIVQGDRHTQAKAKAKGLRYRTPLIVELPSPEKIKKEEFKS